MTRVCLIGTDDCTLQYELLSRETAREALTTYDLRRPFENTIALRTVSVGAAVSLLNDLDWYLTRFVDAALVQDPSVSEDEWLSRELATELRNGAIEPDETAEFCKIYGVERAEPAGASASEPAQADESETEMTETAGRTATTEAAESAKAAETAVTADETSPPPRQPQTRRLVEPLYVRRTDGTLPEYDLRDVDSTLVVRLTEAEHSP
ncbi:DUF5804 family protein [Natrialba asiatica]|uniref:Uncharacterized protein n=1 Tax=Natrialba asiatica (strain ATCC 700177 / DSM 12278 / JCM 9576 / FERM P-10747 / NBRC 102637 / 172P1) TaxID=29540 RepID=M0ATC9_NATA1|nr:DUF5804 family protein [Natrialba asiatica]ELZ00629.1 hypothetical protein C481_13334 [Natrialba asiatica DSM 12278]